MKIGRKEQADLDILKAAALLHDTARRKENSSHEKVDHADEGAKLAKKILIRAAFPQRKIPHVLHCIRSHRFRGTERPRTLEAKILSDADKLDAIGAIGVARVFAVAGERGHPFYDRIPSVHTPVKEYRWKLRKIGERIQTPSARSMARRRSAFLQQFFLRLARELRGRA